MGWDITEDHSLFIVDQSVIKEFLEQVASYSAFLAVEQRPSRILSEKNFRVLLLNIWLILSRSKRTLSLDPYKAIAYPMETHFLQTLCKQEELRVLQHVATAEQKLLFSYHLTQQIEYWFQYTMSMRAQEIFQSYQQTDYFLKWKKPCWEQDHEFLSQQKQLIYEYNQLIRSNSDYQLMLLKALSFASLK